MMNKYDYLIVGSGLFGAVFAHEAVKRGKRCLVLERRPHIGGNIFSDDKEGIPIHCYGAHIFHTSNEKIWRYINQFTSFNQFINSPIANYKGELYNLPFNMNTFAKMWGIVTPQEAEQRINAQRAEISGEPNNLEDQAIRLVGQDIYQKLIKGYTEKQWGRACSQLPPFIIKRLPVRFTFDNNYFNDRYQGIPHQGYTPIIEKLLEGSTVKVNTDFMLKRSQYRELADKMVYTGMIDAYFDYCYGELDYRSLRFETKRFDMENYQGVAVMNYTVAETPYTRIIEHKHFNFGKQPFTYITYEYPTEWTRGQEAYYPVNDDANMKRYALYQKLSLGEKDVIFGGRLAEYRYYDMDRVIAAALEAVNREFGEESF